MYNDDNYLQLSGLQHYLFCPRQWALIHIEAQWQENLRTVDGELMHKNVHKEGSAEKRGDKLTVRGMRIASPSLGVSGQCDAVEFQKNAQGIQLPGYSGSWQPMPVEYKHGSPKENLCDAAQLCGQAMCLEEMLCCSIPAGALYYGETRRRQTVEFTPELRPCFGDRFVLTMVNSRRIAGDDFEITQSGAVLLTEDGRKKFLKAWQERKQEQITHPYLQEKIPWGLVPYVQALLLARCLRGDLDGYPPFLWK